MAGLLKQVGDLFIQTTFEAEKAKLTEIASIVDGIMEKVMFQVGSLLVDKISSQTEHNQINHEQDNKLSNKIEPGELLFSNAKKNLTDLCLAKYNEINLEISEIESRITDKKYAKFITKKNIINRLNDLSKQIPNLEQIIDLILDVDFFKQEIEKYSQKTFIKRDQRSAFDMICIYFETLLEYLGTNFNPKNLEKVIGKVKQIKELFEKLQNNNEATNGIEIKEELKIIKLEFREAILDIMAFANELELSSNYIATLIQETGEFYRQIEAEIILLENLIEVRAGISDLNSYKQNIIAIKTKIKSLKDSLYHEVLRINLDVAYHNSLMGAKRKLIANKKDQSVIKNDGKEIHLISQDPNMFKLVNNDIENWGLNMKFIYSCTFYGLGTKGKNCTDVNVCIRENHNNIYEIKWINHEDSTYWETKYTKFLTGKQYFTWESAIKEINNYNEHSKNKVRLLSEEEMRLFLKLFERQKTEKKSEYLERLEKSNIGLGGYYNDDVRNFINMNSKVYFWTANSDNKEATQALCGCIDSNGNFCIESIDCKHKCLLILAEEEIENEKEENDRSKFS